MPTLHEPININRATAETRTGPTFALRLTSWDAGLPPFELTWNLAGATQLVVDVAAWVVACDGGALVMAGTTPSGVTRFRLPREIAIEAATALIAELSRHVRSVEGGAR